MKSLLKKIYNKPLVKNNAIKLINAIYSPPYRQPTMEFRYGVWMGISSIHCEDGRHLGENNTGPFHLREEIPTNYHTTKFNDSRKGGISNMSALHNVMKVWTEAMEVIVAIRHEYSKRYLNGKQTLSVVELYLLAKVCVSMPAYLARKKVSPVSDGQLNNIIAAEFQLISGVFMIGRFMMEQGEEWLSCDSMMSAQEMFDYADANHIFTSPDGHVCGGSQRKIMELLSCIIDSTDCGYSVDSSADFLTDIVGDIDGYFEYAIVAIEMELKLTSIQLGLMSDLHNITQEGQNFGGEFVQKYNKAFLDVNPGCEIGARELSVLPQRIRIYKDILATHFSPSNIALTENGMGAASPKPVFSQDFEESDENSRIAIKNAATKICDALAQLMILGGVAQNQLNAILGWNADVPILLKNAKRKMDFVLYENLEKEFGVKIAEG